MSASAKAMAVALPQIDMGLIDAFIARGVDEALAVKLVTADIVIDHGPDAVPVNPHARPMIARELDWLAKALEKSSTVPRKGAQEAGGWNQTKELTLEGLGILGTFNLDARVQVSVRDIIRYRIAKILLSYPLDGPPAKIRRPRERFKPRRRERTPQELRALQDANQRSHEAAQRRREAKATTRATRV